MNIRDRIKELRRVPAGDLRPSPRNWRTHPKKQQDALRGVLAEVGYADALIARELPDGTLEIVDGHLRAETTPDTVVPVLVTDLSEGEAALVLATLDPMTGMAEVDTVKLDALLREVETSCEEVAGVLTALAEQHGVIPSGSAFDVDAASAEADFAKKQEDGSKTATVSCKIVCLTADTERVIDAIRKTAEEFDGVKVYV